ncbi:TPA: hypothetical protein ROW14_002420 [Yersinia enterocolitica]|nr:hypothetical protein [Yersinia enterocolitica]
MIIKLDSLPDLEPYFWSDYLEFRALVSADKCFSRGELASLMRSQAVPGSRDLCDQRWSFAIQFIETRIALFGEDYPFYFSADKDTIYLKYELYDDFNKIEKLYLALLICSNIKYITPNRRNEITNSFEKISFPIFKNLMPVGATVNHCWASAGAQGVYTGLLYDKMVKIASDIRCTANFTQNHFKPGDRGDGGIDILAWHDMGDNRDSIPIALAQCGCSKDEWVIKQLEASPAKLWTMLPANHPWATYYFLPQDLRWQQTDWAHKSDFGQAIFVDRLRLINLTRRDPTISHRENIPYVAELIAMEYIEA